ncbi:MAG TPA: TIGR03619 family F420-dependent LLM class oxidoreductase [Acidimicrobiales bacterium]|jgi:probable F420-dependent oxidoreductase
MRFWNAFGYIDPRQATGVAAASEAAGFHGLVVPDHSHYPRQLSTPYPYTADGSPPFPPETPWPDVWCVITAMAVTTTTLRFATAVYVAAARPLHTVAHQVATTAVISDDRVALGVGVGWMREDYDVYGQPFEQRGERLDEMIDALRMLWQPGWVEFEGEHYHVPPMRLSPVPSAPIPIYAGGDSEPARRRAATRCDGWVLAGPLDLASVQDRVTDMHRRLAAAGRAVDDFTIVAMAPDPWDIDFHRRLEDLGVHDVVCVPWTDMGCDVATKREAVERFAEQVISVAG